MDPCVQRIPIKNQHELPVVPWKMLQSTFVIVCERVCSTLCTFSVCCTLFTITHVVSVPKHALLPHSATTTIIINIATTRTTTTTITATITAMISVQLQRNEFSASSVSALKCCRACQYSVAMDVAHNCLYFGV